MRDDAPVATAVSTRGLTKRFGDRLAVDTLDLDLAPGEFFGLLGPNGSGKTTTVHMLSTLVRPTAGRATVAGLDVRRHARAVRARIGVVFQEPALDRSLSAAENLRLAGRLHGLTRAEIAARSDELLTLFGLQDHRDRPVAALSGGMRRALDIARGVLHRPDILFLDEPTIGLDVPNRRAIWAFIERLRRDRGATVFLTTHYLEEAVGCDRVAFIKNGRIVETGAPRVLIDALASRMLEIEADDLASMVTRLEPRLGQALIERDTATFRLRGNGAQLAALHLELATVATAVRVRRPNLNDVFLWSLR